jgi:hypothetical protein
MIFNVLSLVRKNPGSSVSGTINKFGKIAGKLMLLALLVSILWFIRVVVAGLQQPIVETFNADSKRWADCTTSAASTATWSSLGGDVNECNSIPNAGDDMFMTVSLMAVVKNMQACIVGLVWGSSGAVAVSKILVSSAVTRISSGSSGKVGIDVSSKASSVAQSEGAGSSAAY